MDTSNQGFTPGVIVIQDPGPGRGKGGRKYPCGYYADGALGNLLKGRAITLPGDSVALAYNSLSGFNMTWFGDGNPWNFAHPGIVAQSSIYLSPGFTVLSWMALLVPDPNWNSEDSGSMRLIGDTSQRGFTALPLSSSDAPIQVDNLPANNGQGWIVSGRNTVTGRFEGVGSVALFGNPRGVCVRWLALSLTPS